MTAQQDDRTPLSREPSSPAASPQKREGMVERLVDAAISILHHDTTEGSEVDLYERAVLRGRFAAIVADHRQPEAKS